MAKNNNAEPDLGAILERTNDLLRRQLILQLVMLGVPHHSIRKIVKCDMKYITEMLKPLKGKIVPK